MNITTVLPVHESIPRIPFIYGNGEGYCEKTALMNFAHTAQLGLIAVDLNEDDTLIGAAITDGNKDIMLCSNSGKAVRFSEPM